MTLPECFCSGFRQQIQWTPHQQQNLFKYHILYWIFLILALYEYILKFKYWFSLSQFHQQLFTRKRVLLSCDSFSQKDLFSSPHLFLYRIDISFTAIKREFSPTERLSSLTHLLGGKPSAAHPHRCSYFLQGSGCLCAPVARRNIGTGDARERSLKASLLFFQ
jgi:hypothetical protein